MRILCNLLTLLFFLFFSQAVAAQSQSADTAIRYIKVPAGYLMVLKQNDNVFEEIEKMAVKENISSANLNGMGFVNVEFGYFNFKKKKYTPKKFDNAELASMQGSIAWQNGKPSLHIHGVTGDKHFKANAGHILSAYVSTGTLEITVTVHDKKLERKKDEALGANVLMLKD